MARVRDITDVALRRANVVASGQTVAAEYSDDALTRLNDWMASFSTQGWEVKEADGTTDYTHSALTLNSDWPLDDKFIYGTQAILATILAEEYGDPITPKLASDASEGMSAYSRAFAPSTKATLPRYLRPYLQCR